MAQHDMNIANQSFPDFRTDLNNVLNSAATSNSGATAPGVTAGTTAFTGEIWCDTGTTGKLKYKFYDGANWVELFEITISGSTAAIPSSVSIEGESDPNAIPFAIALGG